MGTQLTNSPAHKVASWSSGSLAPTAVGAKSMPVVASSLHSTGCQCCIQCSELFKLMQDKG